MEPIKSIITEENKQQRYNVNNNVKNVASNKETIFGNFIEDLVEKGIDKPEAIAKMIAEQLQDTSNLNFHKKVVNNTNHQLLFECVAITQAALRDGQIRTTPARFYVGILKRKGVSW